MNFTEGINVTEALNVSVSRIRTNMRGRFTLKDVEMFGQLSRPGYLYTLRDIEMYGSLILLPIGIISNVLAFIIFMKWKPSATTLHLRFLAVSDAVTVFSTIFVRSNMWAANLNIPVFLTTHVMVCRLLVYLTGVGYFSSSLILTSITIERFLCVAFPLRVKSWKLEKLSKILLTIYTFVSLAAMSFHFFAHEIYKLPGNFKLCLISQEKTFFAKLRFNLFSNVFCGGIILILTILIPILLFRQKQSRTNLGSDSNSIKEYRVTVMLLTVTCLFIILRFPLTIMQEIYQFKYVSAIDTLWPVAFIMLILNHSTNFFIYFIFLEAFRSTFYQMFSCIKCNPTTWFNKETEESQGASELNTSVTAVPNPSVE